MQDQNANQEANYRKFIQQVADTEQVWGLSEGDIWATSSSNEFEDTEVILFWSDAEAAKACAADEWANYKAEALPVSEFLENWCVGMYDDELLVGANWTADMQGKEVDPLVIALDVVQELKSREKEIKLEQYDSLSEFEEQVIDALEGDEE
ncbi:DUF2750 domain-containing protein [Pontibacter sp. BT310]|jgi:hypothetical protein|uniref:DUF2750 domain-containing protein n=1 Tax=Pontibacter populi TaxID=890055 RepID=A0ABS6XCS7_9BACT|nr:MULTISPECIES: DUF2750 domain-containing protein [Pontibacter]MBJ6118058.1 DUF2750 domain-containing protein [Pontibacter sp. BT310]MBR0570485.1 DUF2750 domain-containing protein [Microvirga sp. STS03]MBW3364911.1 DUF2750 domain-containing protein [Pontibacter populi]